MESVRNHYYSITNRMLSLAGQWPYQSERTRLFRVTILTVFSLSMIIPQVAQIIRCDGNVRCIFLIIPSALLIITVLTKLYTCQFNSSKIKNLTDHLRDDWKKLEGAEEYKIMKTYAARARLLSLVYCLYMYVSNSLFMLLTIIPQILNVVLPLNESRPLMMPYDAYYFVDTEQYYFYIIFHIWVGVIILLAGVLAHDCFFFTYIEHVCSLFAIAGFRLNTVSRNDRDDAANNSKNDNIYNRKIAISIHIHWRAIWFAEHLEDIFCISFVVQMMIVVVGMSITLLQITLQFEEVVEAIKSVIFILSQLMHLFCYSMQGQKLIDHSIQLREQIYNSSWYEIPVKSQKLLLYVMQRSLESNFLSAGRIYVFSLSSFTTVLRSAMSYFTVLASFQ